MLICHNCGGCTVVATEHDWYVNIHHPLSLVSKTCTNDKHIETPHLDN